VAGAHPRGPPLPAEEHVVRDARQEEDVVEAVDEDGADEEAHHPAPVLRDVPAERAINRAPGCEQDERHEQMRGAQAEEGTVGRAAVDEQRNQRRRYHERQERHANGAMGARSFTAEHQEPETEQGGGRTVAT